MNFTDPSLYWLIGGIALMIIELLVGGAFFIYLAIACAGGIIADWLGFGLSGQLIGYAISALITLLLFRPLFNRFFFRKGGQPTNADALVGRKALVTEAISEHGGRVVIGGENWRAVSEAPFPEGATVTITAVSGATLQVIHNSPNSSPSL